MSAEPECRAMRLPPRDIKEVGGGRISIERPNIPQQPAQALTVTITVEDVPVRLPRIPVEPRPEEDDR